MDFEQEFEKVTSTQVSSFTAELIRKNKEEEVIKHFKELISKCNKLFLTSFLNVILKVNGIDNEIYDNFDMIIDMLGPTDISRFMENFNRFPKVHEKIINEFDKLIDKCQDDYLINIIDNFKEDIDIKKQIDKKFDFFKNKVVERDRADLIQYKKENGEGKEIINNFDEWYEMCSKNRLQFIEAVYDIEGADAKLKEKFSDIVANNKYGILCKIMNILIPVIGREEVFAELPRIILGLDKDQLLEIWQQLGEEKDADAKLEKAFKENYDNEKYKPLVIMLIDNVSKIESMQNVLKRDLNKIIDRCKEEHEMEQLMTVITQVPGISKNDVEQYLQTGLDLDKMDDALLRQITMIEDTIEDSMTKKGIYMIIQELIQHENVNIEDVKELGSGQYTKAFKIGEYVLKFQKGLNSKKIRYDPRILQPIVRRAVYDYKEGQKSNEPSIYIEVDNLVDDKWYENLSGEEIDKQIYAIYKEMRDRGIVWTDMKPENLGRLLKDNKINYQVDGEEITVKDESVGIYGRNTETENEQKVLKKGELVILDVDFIYDAEKDASILDLGDEMYKCYEYSRRYERDKEKQKKKEQGTDR